MIEEETFAPIIATVPGFDGRWTHFLQDWASEEEMPWYLGMSELAHYIVDSYAAASTSEFPRFFEAVEAALETESEELRGLLAVGLFEDVQNVATHRPFGHKVFEQWLGPRSQVMWHEVEAGMQCVAEWTVDHYRRHWWQVWRPKRFNATKALSQVQNPELRKTIESAYRKK
jgi:hypothetical protein